MAWRPTTPMVAVAIVVAIAVVLVAFTLRAPPEVPMYAPTPPAPADSGRALVGPRVYTVDATSGDRWTKFSFRL